MAVWIACIAGLMAMARLANSAEEALQTVFRRYLLVTTLATFAVLRLARAWTLGAESSSLAWLPTLASLGTVLAAAAMLPRLRGFRESYALARLAHARFLAAAESTLDDFYIFEGVPGSDGSIVDFRFNYVNPNAERRLHMTREELLGKILTEVRPFMITSGLIHTYLEVVRTGEPFIADIFIDDDRIKNTWLNVQVVKLGTGIAITSRDVTETHRSTDRIQYLAHYDQLTGLPNRTLFQERMQKAIERAERQNEKVALFMLDIDNFKRINDTLGHANGDALLTAIGQRLLACVRDTDTVARLGGDEFVIVMPNFHSMDDVRRRGSMIVRNVSKVVEAGGHSVTMTVSVGACTYPDGGLEIGDLLKNADQAMYSIKDSGRNGFHIFNGGRVEDVALPDAEEGNLS